ncbi:MAG: adenylate/guanylate cyclase domain-containing protein [Candidatus Sulfobium sp.]
MPRLFKAILLGLLVGIMGLAVSPLHSMLKLDENVGMGLLFKMRGARQAPADAVVVSIDKESSEKLNLPDNPDKWPRSLHARLTETLAKKGASVIAFDVHFIEPRSARDDRLFAEALKKAGNVVLCEPLKMKEVPLSGGQEYDDTASNIVKVVPPIDLFTRAAAAIAPFTLPRIPFKVSQYWTFETGAGDSPTMPAVALQLFAAPVYGDFIHLLQKTSPDRAGELPIDIKTARETTGVKELMKKIRGTFESDPLIADRMLGELERSDTLSADLKKRRLVESLIKMYGGGNSRFIDYYGPPGTVTTIPYYRALESGGEAAGDKKIDFKGKAVFVGLSEVLLAERKDSFYTVFSRANGTFIGGVEIMATSFLNLLTDTPMKPVSTSSYILVIFLWGVLIGIICRISPVGYAAVATAGLGVLYLIAAEYQFKNSNTWYPVIIPLFLQAPVAFFGAVIWDYIETNKERQNIKKAFEYYLPKDVVSQLSKDIAQIKTGSQVVHGVCLFTDVAEYTSLCETMGPRELGIFMNKYYETLFRPVKQHDGFVSGIIGDAMLALWVSAGSETALRGKACSAALDINMELQRFDQSPGCEKLKTRIGLHCGQIFLGHVGALDHYEYTPMGDIVNTASRIEGLNKYLGTSVLVSEDIVDSLDRFLIREVGKFRLKGKAKPIVAYELMGLRESAEEKQKIACDVFAEALSAFRSYSWDVAKEDFGRVIEILGEDGPSVFYQALCDRYKEDQPAESWDKIVEMGSK